jgi:CDGSH-type Zn-finger protein
MDQNLEAYKQKKIEVSDGPYIVTGNIPLVSKIQVVSEYGEPIAWKKEGDIATDEAYFLCRCGNSSYKPFCDGTHYDIKFDGTETAPVNLRAERQETLPGSRNMLIRMDGTLCTSSGFCANRLTSITEMAARTDDIQVRALAIAMIGNCPSGALTYALKAGEGEIEADLPLQIACTTEITTEGAILGPYWVTGWVPIIRFDRQPFEIRNRVALCSCGLSQIKPLCDGSHREHPMYVPINSHPTQSANDQK